MLKRLKKSKNIKIILLISIILANIIFQTNNIVFCEEFETADNYEYYTGQIETLSFTTLMSFPEKALAENNGYNSYYNETKITINEFKNILDELYKNNYILVDIFDVIDREKIYQKKLYLPQNKKPIILTFDNVSYKSNYQNLGQIDKIIIDRNNNLASYTTKKSIQDRIQYDNEFILILENFIKKHPDFSYNNARGIIFLTGENGILGYNTNHSNASSKYEKKRVTEVIKKLKNLGWRFGSNNYTYKDERTKSALDFAKELSLWNSEVKDVIGITNLYAFPLGICNEKHLELLITNGFKIFFNGNPHENITFNKDICFIPRKEVNGKTLRTNNQQFEDLFDSKLVYDNENRKIFFDN